MRPVDTTGAVNLFEIAERAASAYGDRDFLVLGRREESISFKGFAERAARFGRLIADLGVRPGDRVALWMTNKVDWAVAAYGIARCGAVTVAVSTRLTPREVAHLLGLTGPSLWIVEDVFLGKVNAAERIEPVLEELRERNLPLPKVLVWAASGARHAGTLDWHEELTKERPAIAPAAELTAQVAGGPNDEVAGVAAILSTSGTTGAPKGVMLKHTGLIRLAEAVGQRQELEPTQRFFSVAPFFHCSGYMHGLLTTLIAGSTYFSTRQYNAEETWEVLTAEGVTAYHGFIGALQDLPKLPDFDPGRLRLNRAWYSAAAAEMARLEGILGTKMCEVYGLTETGGNVCITTRNDPVEMRHDSDGRPHDGVDVKIVDGSGAPVAEEVPGEILVRGWNVMKGYFRDPAATAKTVDQDGWLHTGDQGVRLPGGYVKFLSRLKDVIRVGGENLSPMEVEEVLVGHPAVSEVAVVAAPHDRLMEVPVAFVVRRAGTTASEAELQEHCRRQLANFKVPTRFVFVSELPRTGATNRIQKARLREMLQELENA